MAVKTYKLVIVFVSIILGLIAYATFFKNVNQCKSRIEYNFQEINKDISLDDLFQPIEESEVSEQMNDWRDFNQSPDSMIKLDTINVHGRNGILLKATHDNKEHYASIILPRKLEKNRKYPLLIWANGLNQFSPTVSLSHRKEIQILIQKLPDYFILIPSFRGQSLEIGGKLYCSDGFFGDAFDGATDDALRILKGTIDNFKNVSTERLAIYGVSRGGTVALLAGIRDKKIKCVVAQSGPSDFLGRQFLEKYGLQYRYQFFSRSKDLKEIRKKIIKSSPIHFIQFYQNHLFIIHGKNDRTVNISHSKKIIERAKTKNIETLITSSGHRNFETQKVVSWLVKNN